MNYESVEEFIGRGGKITMCKPHKARGAQKPQTMRSNNAFTRGRKAFTLGTGRFGVCSKRSAKATS